MSFDGLRRGTLGGLILLIESPILIRTLPGSRAQRPLIRCVVVVCVGDYFASTVSQINERGTNRKKKLIKSMGVEL